MINTPSYLPWVKMMLVLEFDLLKFLPLYSRYSWDCNTDQISMKNQGGEVLIACLWLDKDNYNCLHWFIKNHLANNYHGYYRGVGKLMITIHQQPLKLLFSQLYCAVHTFF